MSYERDEVHRVVGEQMIKIVQQGVNQPEAIRWIESYAQVCLQSEYRSVVYNWSKVVLESIKKKKCKKWSEVWFSFSRKMMEEKQFDHTREAGVVMWSSILEVFDDSLGRRLRIEERRL